MNAPLTSDPGDDSPSVIGADLAPMPTEADRRKAWRSIFIGYAVEAGIDAGHAAELFDAGSDDWDYSENPKVALEDEMAYWSNDE